MECTDPRPVTIEGIKELTRREQLRSAVAASSGSDSSLSPAIIPPPYRKTDIAALLADSQQRCKRHVDRFGTGADSIRRCFVGRRVRRNTLATEDEKEEKRADATDDDNADDEAHIFDFEEDLKKVQAPMVRCSRPPFRKLCSLWGTDIVYTHMILADCFVRSASARTVDFALFRGEEKLITQFAAKSGPTLAQAAAIVSPFTDGIDINCGCPQKWAMKDGYGSALLERPELVADMVSCVSNSGAGVPCVVKMRVYDDLKTSVEFAKRAEKAGAAWLTVHGRTPWCTSSATVRHEAIKLIKESVSIPVVANGGARDPESTIRLALEANVGAVMAGQGLLDNPAMFDRSSSCYGAVVARGWERMPTLGAAYKQQQREALAAGQGLGENGERPAAEEDAATASDPLAAASVFRPPTSLLVSSSSSAGIAAPSSFWDDCYNAHFSLSTHPNTMPDACPSSSPSFSHLGTAVADMPPLACISDFCRLALHTELPYKTTQHHLLMMAHKYLSPAERIYVGEQPSLLGITEYLRSQGLYVPEGRYQPNVF